MAKKKVNAGGPGKKQCPDCGKYSGVRTKQCSCGHEFGVKEKNTPNLSSAQIATVLAAQELIRLCGGENAAIDLIKAVGKTKG